MVRTVLFICGLCLALASAILSAQPLISAGQAMWTLRAPDMRVLLLMTPFALAVAASFISLFMGWRWFRTGRTAAMAAVLVAGTVLPLAAAPVGHAALCTAICRPL
jgi:hypothetical protein